SHRDAVAQDRDRRPRDDRADLLEARLRRADAFARERADDLHPAGRAQVRRRRRGDYGSRGRSAAHSVLGAAPGRSARRHLRARRLQPDSPGLARSHRRLLPPLMAIDRQGTGLAILRIAIGVFFIFESFTKIRWLGDPSILAGQFSNWSAGVAPASASGWY